MGSTNPVEKRRHTTQALGGFFAAAVCGAAVIAALVMGREVQSSLLVVLVLGLAVGFYSLRVR